MESKSLTVHTLNVFQHTEKITKERKTMKKSIILKLTTLCLLINILILSCTDKKLIPKFHGRILILKESKPREGKEPFKREIYVCSSKEEEPIKPFKSAYDSLLTHEILAIAMDASYIIFSPDLLINTKTGKLNHLPHPDGQPIYNFEFSSNNKYLVYTTSGTFSIFVYDIELNTVKKIFTAEHKAYKWGFSGEEVRYAGLGEPKWLSSEALIFGCHVGLPSYFRGDNNQYRKEFEEINHINILSKEGKILLSMKDSLSYKVSDSAVIRLKYDEIDSWFDTKELLKGKYHSNKSPWLHGFNYRSISPNGRVILVSKKNSDSTSAIELRTGKGTIISEKGIYDNGTAWSPDGSMLASLDNGLSIITLSGKKVGKIDFPDESGFRTIIQWKILAWMP
jgi:hypothetical protein